MEELREVLLKKILEEKKVNSSNLEIIIHALRNGSALEARIWKVFHKDLVKGPETLNFILDIIPSEYAEKIEITNEANDVLKESPMFTALAIFAEFTKLRGDGYTDVLRLDLWTNSSNWHSFQSELAVVLQNLLRTHASTDNSCNPNNLCGLNGLPIETLPPVLRLAVSLLAVNYLYSCTKIDELTNKIITRCFEDTDIFRYISAVGFVERVVQLEFHSASFITVLATELAKYTKMLNELQENFSIFQEPLTRGDKNLSQLCVTMLEGLVRPVCDASVAKEKRSAAEALALQISKVSLTSKVWCVLV